MSSQVDKWMAGLGRHEGDKRVKDVLMIGICAGIGGYKVRITDELWN